MKIQASSKKETNLIIQLHLLAAHKLIFEGWMQTYLSGPVKAVEITNSMSERQYIMQLDKIFVCQGKHLLFPPT